jgi:lipopolysaccharide transport system ATP-binding protein
MAFFYYEFQITGVIGIPICGLVISNERGIIAHGKNSWQFQKAVPEIDGNSSLILCRHEIQLDLGVGEYTIEIGLASVNAEIWARRDQISHEEMSALHDRQCHVPSAAAFSIGLNLRNGVPVLSHHGIANLNGDMNISVQPRVLT